MHSSEQIKITTTQNRRGKYYDTSTLKENKRLVEFCRLYTWEQLLYLMLAVRWNKKIVVFSVPYDFNLTTPLAHIIHDNHWGKFDLEKW